MYFEDEEDLIYFEGFCLFHILLSRHVFVSKVATLIFIGLMFLTFSIFSDLSAFVLFQFLFNFILFSQKLTESKHCFR